MPGVLAVMTGEDFTDVGGNPAGWLINSRDGTPMKEPKRPVLAHGKVRHVGDAYAVGGGRDARTGQGRGEQLAEADITELPAIVDMAAAVADTSNRVHDEIAGQRLLRLGLDRGQPRRGGCGLRRPRRMSPRWNW